MLMLSAFPRIDTPASYLIFRTTRLNWLIGQIITVFVLTFGYCLMILLASMVMCIGCNVFTANHWSETAAVLKQDDLLVLLLKESFESLSSLLDTYTVEAYADIWIYYNGLNTETYYEGDLLCANYQADVDGTTYQYLAVFYQSEDGFWLMQFACTDDDFESLYGEMIEIAESLIID